VVKTEKVVKTDIVAKTEKVVKTDTAAKTSKAAKSDTADKAKSASETAKAVAMPPTKDKPARHSLEGGALEKKLSTAIEMVGAGKADEAHHLFEAIVEEALEKSHFGIAKVARSYLLHNQNSEVVPPEADPIQETVFLLNAKKPEVVLEKIDVMVKAKNATAHAYYLKALAHASAHQFDLSAQSLRQAIEMDQALLNIYRLEPDFKACRRSSLFSEFELA